MKVCEKVQQKGITSYNEVGSLLCQFVFRGLVRTVMDSFNTIHHCVRHIVYPQKEAAAAIKLLDMYF